MYSAARSTWTAGAGAERRSGAIQTRFPWPLPPTGEGWDGGGVKGVRRGGAGKPAGDPNLPASSAPAFPSARAMLGLLRSKRERAEVRRRERGGRKILGSGFVCLSFRAPEAGPPGGSLPVAGLPVGGLPRIGDSPGCPARGICFSTADSSVAVLLRNDTADPLCKPARCRILRAAGACGIMRGF